jgi:hypothetical protein
MVVEHGGDNVVPRALIVEYEVHAGLKERHPGSGLGRPNQNKIALLKIVRPGLARMAQFKISVLLSGNYCKRLGYFQIHD